MPTAADFDPQTLEILRQRGIRPEDLIAMPDEKMSPLHAALSTLKARAGSIIGGGGGTVGGGIAGGEIGAFGGPAAPITIPAGILIGSVVGGLGGSYAGEKAQQAIVPSDVEQQLQDEAARAQEEHPWVSRGTEIAASALASGGKPSPSALLKAGKSILAGDIAAPVVRNIATQAAVNPAIDIGTSLAQGNGLPSRKDLLWDAAGGALFSEPSALGRLGRRHSSEPSAEPTANPVDVIPPVGTGNIGPLKMAQTEPLTTTELVKNTDEVTQNKMEQTTVTENPIDKKAVVEDATKAPEIKVPQIPDEAVGKSGLTKAEEDELRTMTINSAPERYTSQPYSPEDLQTYNDLKKKMSEQVEQIGTPEYHQLWQDFENVRNKYGGMPPKVKDTTELNEINSSIAESNIRNPIVLAQHIQSGTATTGSVLQHLANSPNHPMSDLARHMAAVADKESLSVPWAAKSTSGQDYDRSSYLAMSKGKVVLRPRDIGDSRTVMEEAIHSMTSNKIKTFRGVDGPELYQRLKEYSESGENPAIRDITGAYLKTAEHLGYTEQMFHSTDEWSGERLAGNPDIMAKVYGRTSGHGNIPYAMGNLDEFIAHAFKNEQFQHLLNEMPSGVEGKTVWQRIVDAVKKLFGLDIKQGSMLEHVISRSNELIAQDRPQRKLPKEYDSVSHAPKTMDDEHYMGRIGRFTRDVISRVSDIGRPDAKELATATKLSLNEQDRLAGRYRNSTIEAGKGLTLKDMEVLNHVIDHENTTGTLARQMLTTDAQRKFYDTVKKNMSETGDYAIANNMPVASDKGPRPLKKDPAHWPSMMNDKVSSVYRSGDLGEIAKLDKEFDTWNQTKVGLTPAGSAKVIKDWKDAIQGSIRSSDVSHQDYFKAFRRAMGTPIPPSFREQNPVKNMARYFDRASIALSHYKFIESNPKVMATLGATHDAWGKPITPNPDGSLANNQQVKDLLNQFKGNPRGLGDASEQSASSLMSNLLISGPTLESHKLISNAVGAVNLSDNPYQLSRALAHGLSGIKEGYRHAVENGLAKLSASSTLDMFNGSLSASQRMNALGKAIRDVSTIGGLTTKANLGFLQSYFEYLVPSKIQRANGGDINAQRFIKRLDPTYAIGKTYQQGETQQLASVAAGYIHGTGDIRSLPAWMMHDSELSGFFKLAHWSVAQTNNFMTNVWTPAAQGNIKPLLTSVFGSVVGGYMIKELREQMQGKKSGIPSLTEIASSDRGVSGNAGPLAYNAIAAMQYSGFGGLLSQVAKYPFDFVYKNIPQGATFPLDQIATDLSKTIGQVTSAIANDPNLNWVDLAKAFTGHVLQNDMQLSRIAINQGINAGLITGLPAEKKLLSDKMGQLRRFDMVEGLPYADIEQTANPYMNIEQQKFKHEPDVQQAVRMIPELVTNIMERYKDQPDVMMSKLKALKENQYNTMPSLESMPMQFFRYMQYVQRTKGEEAAQDMMRDYMTHRVVNQVKSSVAP